MKYLTTKKAVRAGYVHIIGTGYCSLQNLLYFRDPVAYSTRAEGWACDYYGFGNTVISTGYAPLTTVNATVSYDRIQYYDDRAAVIVKQYDEPYEQRKAGVEALLEAFVEECITGGGK